MPMPFIASFLMSFILVLVSMAFYTLMERKFMGYFQLRKGPNKVSIMGLPQPFADAIKLFLKEQNKPHLMNKQFFIMAPIMGLILALLTWGIYPHTHPAMFIKFGILFFLCVSSMNVYATFISGWCSNSKYALLGALRSIAQTISYEVSMALIMLSALMVIQSMDMTVMTMNMKSWVMLMFMPMMVMWFTTNLAETNRTPFDFAEGESELVSGFNTEYSSSMFALIFMAEYTNILLMSLLSVIMFTGITPIHIMSDVSMIFKTMIMAMVFVWMRCTLPRLRYDKLMYLTWKSFLPISLSVLTIITPLILYL